MRQTLNVLYRNAAEEFAGKLGAELGDRLHAVVLFGSVARKQARRASDTDVLVVGEDADLDDTVFDIAYTVMGKSNFESLITAVYYTRMEFEELVRMRTPFILTVLGEGSILYDDGTFKEALDRVPGGR